jgi:hypothetical protein
MRLALLALLLLTAPAGCAASLQTPLAPPPPPDNKRMGFVLGDDAAPDDLFCVMNPPGPHMEVHELGLKCSTVLAVRKFVASHRWADAEPSESQGAPVTSARNQ